MVLIITALGKTGVDFSTFPSPYGDYGSYLGAVETYLITWDDSFRPLTGIMVLIADEEFEKYIVVRGMFPSPYGDYGSYLKQ